MQTRIRIIFPALVFLAACSSQKAVEPAPAPSPCYLAKSQAEFQKWFKVLQKKDSVVIEGKSYSCVSDPTPIEAFCYLAKSAKEFKKLSQQQDAHPERPLQIGGKFYRCIQNFK